MNKQITVRIVTPEQTMFEGESFAVTLPSQDGDIMILPEHIAYIGALRSGEIELRDEISGEARQSFVVSGGMIEFRDNVLTILADSAEHAESIDIERAEEAKKRAEELMQQAPEDTEEYARVAALLDRQLARLHVARKHRAKSKHYPDTQSS